MTRKPPLSAERAELPMPPADEGPGTWPVREAIEQGTGIFDATESELRVLREHLSVARGSLASRTATLRQRTVPNHLIEVPLYLTIYHFFDRL